MKKVALLEFNKNFNVGNFLVTNDKFCLIGENINKIKKNKIEKVLNVPLINMRILNSNFIGIFIFLDNKNLIVSENIFEKEIKDLKKICKKFDVNLNLIKDNENCFGNTICISKNFFILSKLHKKNKRFSELSKKLKKKIIFLEDENFNLAGSLLKVNELGKIFSSQELDKKDLKKIEKDVLEIGTINKGSPFISSGVIGNKYGIVIGSNSTTIEIQNIVDNL